MSILSDDGLWPEHEAQSEAEYLIETAEGNGAILSSDLTRVKNHWIKVFSAHPDGDSLYLRFVAELDSILFPPRVQP